MPHNVPMQPRDMDDALARIAELEARLDEAIDTFVRRDDALEAAQVRIVRLEEDLENLRTQQGQAGGDGR